MVTSCVHASRGKGLVEKEQNLSKHCCFRERTINWTCEEVLSVFRIALLSPYIFRQQGGLSVKELKKAYRSKALAQHPDKGACAAVPARPMEIPPTSVVRRLCIKQSDRFELLSSSSFRGCCPLLGCKRQWPAANTQPLDSDHMLNCLVRNFVVDSWG
eukprot:3419325-Amphidinium_carterae.1